MLFTFKLPTIPINLSILLNKDIFGSIDHDLCNAVIIQKLIQNPKSSQGTEHSSGNLFPFLRGDLVMNELMVYDFLDSDHELLITGSAQGKCIFQKKTFYFFYKSECYLLCKHLFLFHSLSNTDYRHIVFYLFIYQADSHPVQAHAPPY